MSEGGLEGANITPSPPTFRRQSHRLSRTVSMTSSRVSWRTQSAFRPPAGPCSELECVNEHRDILSAVYEAQMEKFQGRRVDPNSIFCESPKIMLKQGWRQQMEVWSRVAGDCKEQIKKSTGNRSIK